MLRFAATASTLAFVGIANAGYITETIFIGSVNPNNGGNIFVPYVNPPGNNNPIVGFAITLDFVGGGGTFATDLQLTFDFGGFTQSFGGESAGGVGTPWGWDIDPGFYSFEACEIWINNPIPKSDLIGFQLTDLWGGGTWNNIEITLYKVPAPGALALLGMAGVTGARRRRR